MMDTEMERDTTPPMEKIVGVQQQEILSAAGRDDDTPAAAVTIYVDMNVKGHQENFHRPAEPSAGGAAGQSAPGRKGEQQRLQQFWPSRPGRWQRRTVSNIDPLKLFATHKKAYPIICLVQKCLLACPPSQSDCEELFSLLGLFQGIFMYCMFMR